MLNLKWMGKDRAVKYKPVDRTIMIRITDKLKEFEPLQSDDYIDVLELKFNDINILNAGYTDPELFKKFGRKRNHHTYTLFDESFAEDIIDFVRHYFDEIDTVIVHCKMGISRSRAIILAINHIFNIGHEFEFNCYNNWIYDILLGVNQKEIDEISKITVDNE